MLTVAGMSDGMGLARGGSMIAGMNRLELFISRNRINPFVSNELAGRIHSPIVFITPTGGKAYGYDAEILVELCEVVRMHKSLKMTPAMAAGVSDRLWSMDDNVALVDARAPKLGKRGPYKKSVNG